MALGYIYYPVAAHLIQVDFIETLPGIRQSSFDQVLAVVDVPPTGGSNFVILLLLKGIANGLHSLNMHLYLNIKNYLMKPF